MKYTVDEFKKDLQTQEIKMVYHKYLLGNAVWYFDEYLKCDLNEHVYDQFKAYIANKFNLPFNNIGIVGSAKLGFSLSPKKDETFRIFREGRQDNEKSSDIDLVLVSDKIFQKYWELYIEKYYSFQIKRENLDWVKQHLFQKILVFDAFYDTDSDYQEWYKKTSNYKKEVEDRFKIRHDIHYYVFESWDAVEKYYMTNLQKVKSIIIQKEAFNG